MNLDIWILVFFFKSGYGAGAGTAEFSSRERCEAAIVEITKKVTFRNPDWILCVKK
jgi:hypothetical protein